MTRSPLTAAAGAAVGPSPFQVAGWMQRDRVVLGTRLAPMTISTGGWAGGQQLRFAPWGGAKVVPHHLVLRHLPGMCRDVRLGERTSSDAPFSQVLSQLSSECCGLRPCFAAMLSVKAINNATRNTLCGSEERQLPRHHSSAPERGTGHHPGNSTTAQLRPHYPPTIVIICS